MKAIEILINFLKGNEVIIISEKQKSWLLGQSKNENIKMSYDGFNNYIYFSDCFYKISQCVTHVAGYGGTRGTKAIQGKYKLEKMYCIKFESTGLTAVYRKNDLDYFTSKNEKFNLIAYE